MKGTIFAFIQLHLYKKESHYKERDYFRVNTDLTVELAQQAKLRGVKQFIFFSTMAVYGIEKDMISSGSSLQPKTMYGKSKLAAEQALEKMGDHQFIVSIVRPPMIYGPGCPGNYVSLSKLARKTPIFPLVANERSMLFIDHLSMFIYQVICHQDGGIFHPQDAAYINTSQLVAEIAKQHGKRVFFSKVSGFVLTSIFSNVGVVNKVFGNLTYAKELSRYRDDCYQVVSFEEAVRLTERGV